MTHWFIPKFPNLLKPLKSRIVLLKCGNILLRALWTFWYKQKLLEAYAHFARESRSLDTYIFECFYYELFKKKHSSDGKNFNEK